MLDASNVICNDTCITHKGSPRRTRRDTLQHKTNSPMRCDLIIKLSGNFGVRASYYAGALTKNNAGELFFSPTLLLSLNKISVNILEQNDLKSFKNF